MIGWLTDWLLNWLIDWLVDWFLDAGITDTVIADKTTPGVVKKSSTLPEGCFWKFRLGVRKITPDVRIKQKHALSRNMHQAENV